MTSESTLSAIYHYKASPLDIFGQNLSKFTTRSRRGRFHSSAVKMNISGKLCPRIRYHHLEKSEFIRARPKNLMLQNNKVSYFSLIVYLLFFCKLFCSWFSTSLMQEGTMFSTQIIVNINSGHRCSGM